MGSDLSAREKLSLVSSLLRAMIVARRRLFTELKASLRS
jgi:hypothetical protein